MRRSRPLDHYLLLAALLATLVPMLAMGAMTWMQYRRDVADVERYAALEGQSAARAAAGALGLLAGSVDATLAHVASDLEVGRGPEAALAGAPHGVPGVASLAVTDDRGRIVASTVPAEVGSSLGDTPHFKALAAGAPRVMDGVVRSPTLGQYVLPLARPYHRQGHFAGIAVARLGADAISRALLDDPAPGIDALTFAADEHGRLIVHPNHALAPAGAMAPALPPAGLLEGHVKLRDPATGEDRVAGFARVPQTDWVVVAERRAGDRIVQAGRRLREQWLLTALCSLAALLGARWWGLRLIRPVQRLADAIDSARAARDGVDGRPGLEPVREPGHVEEYQRLAGSYNLLVDELNRRFEEEAGYQATLEAKNAALEASAAEIARQHAELARQQELEVERRAALAAADLLARKNEELTRLSLEAEAANKLKSEFLANMSHELRTPLNAVIGFTDVVLLGRELPQESRARGHLAVVLRNARHLLALIDDVLDLSRVEAGRAVVHLDPVDPAALLEAAVATVSPMAQERGLSLSLEVAPQLGAVMTDEVKTRQIVLNLLSNALKFTAEGGVHVSAVPRGPDRWAVLVRDTGIGIAPEHQAMIFDAFRQVDGSSTRKAGGTGLGLAIARRLARLMGGELGVESLPGQGSLFTLELPCRAPEGEVAAHAP